MMIFITNEYHFILKRQTKDQKEFLPMKNEGMLWMSPSQTYPECSEGENERTLLYACTSELSPEELARRDIELLKTKLHNAQRLHWLFYIYACIGCCWSFYKHLKYYSVQQNVMSANA